MACICRRACFFSINIQLSKNWNGKVANRVSLWIERSPVSERSVISAGINKHDFGMGRTSQLTGMVVKTAECKEVDRDRSRVMGGRYMVDITSCDPSWCVVFVDEVQMLWGSSLCIVTSKGWLKIRDWRRAVKTTGLFCVLYTRLRILGKSSLRSR